ncbi:MAG: GIY-YIG nuclease family protein [Desulfobacterales bacterium]|nr:GIY-YIG nuclease family protein [Desulfobacterales bacterium]
MKELTREFRIDKKEAYDCILKHGNDINIRLLESQYSTFKAVEEEILSMKDILFSSEYIMQGLEAFTTIPFIKRPFIYFLYDGETLVYIGKTLNLAARIGTHISDNEKVFDRVGYKNVDKSILSLVEEVNIYHYKPVYNKLVWSNVDLFKNVLKMCVFE